MRLLRPAAAQPAAGRDGVDHSGPRDAAIQITLVNTVVEALDRTQGSIRAVPIDHLMREPLDRRFTYKHRALSA